MKSEHESITQKQLKDISYALLLFCIILYRGAVWNMFPGHASGHFLAILTFSLGGHLIETQLLAKFDVNMLTGVRNK